MNLKNLKLKENSKTKLKCFFTLILVFTMVISSIPNINVFANESYDYKYVAFEKDTNGEYKATDINGYGLKQELANGQGNLFPKLFKLVHKNNEDDVRRVYCLDVEAQDIRTDINYSISNIEDGDYYTDEEAKKIRAIVKNSYPYVGIDELVEHIGAKTGDKDFSLTTGTSTASNGYDLARVAITATQLAIWKYSNDFKYDGLQKHFLGTENEKERYSKDIIENVEKLYYKLIDLAELSGEDAEVPVAEILSKEPIIVSENGDTFDIEFRFKIDENSIVENIDYTIENKPSNLEDEHNGFDEDGYERIKVTNIPPGEDIKFVISGTQYVNNEDVFIYKPEGGRENSQYLIGARSGSINISEKFNYVFEKIEATKSLEGKDLKAEEFSFELLDYQGKVLETVKNSADGKIQFTPRTYTKAGTYTYKIREVDESLGGTISNGITYDKNEYEVKVKVTDDGSGNLVSNVEYPNGKITFTNKYEVKETSVSLEATKVLEGKDLRAEEFSFELLDYQGKVLETVKNSSDGKIQFTPRTYTKAGTYTYKIREVDESLGGTISNGITYDTNEYEVKVKVTDDGSGNLVSNVEYPNGKVTFTNKYEVKETSATIKATKTLIGKDLKSGMFRFKLLDEDGNVVETVKNDAAGNIKFSELTFDEVGTYTYQIVEVNEGSDGIIYDSQPVDVKIKVEDKDGKLKTSVSYPSKDPEFKNEYKPGSTSAVIEATKTLEGKDLESGMFSFELLDEEDNILQIVKNSRNGKVRFKAINYDKAGTYKYTVKEVKETLDGIDYDDSEYEVTVKVTDDGNGNLKAEVVYPEGGIVFENTVIEGTLEFTKTDVSTGNVIDGAKIKITCTEGLDKGKVIEFTSSKEGNKFELKAGKYTFEETQAPEGYELTKEVGTFEIKENGEVVKAELKNYPIKGSVKLIKVDKDDKEKRIQGAKFVLLASDKETIIAENLVTDSEGKIIVSNLEPGTYYFKETEAASGYILDETLIEVKVESNQQTIATVTFENEKEQEGGGLPDIDPEGDIPEEEGGYPDTDSNVSSPNINTNNNTNSNVNSSTNSSGSYPKTSDTSIVGYAISGIVSIGTLVGINRKRKDK